MNQCAAIKRILNENWFPENAEIPVPFNNSFETPQRFYDKGHCQTATLPIADLSNYQDNLRVAT